MPYITNQEYNTLTLTFRLFLTIRNLDLVAFVRNFLYFWANLMYFSKLGKKIRRKYF